MSSVNFEYQKCMLKAAPKQETQLKSTEFDGHILLENIKILFISVPYEKI